MILKQNNLPGLTDEECVEIEQAFGVFDETKPVRTYINGEKVFASFSEKPKKKRRENE